MGKVHRQTLPAPGAHLAVSVREPPISEVRMPCDCGREHAGCCHVIAGDPCERQASVRVASVYPVEFWERFYCDRHSVEHMDSLGDFDLRLEGA